jgi:hypothetical protein
LNGCGTRRNACSGRTEEFENRKYYGDGEEPGAVGDKEKDK